MFETVVSWVQIPVVPSINSVDRIELLVSSLTKHKLERLSKTLHKIYKEKYRAKDKKRKYGNINKGFTEEELQRFLSSVKDRKSYLAFLLQSHLGLRVTEVVNMKLDDIDFRSNKVRISTLKAKTGDFMFMPSRVRKFLLTWVQKHQNKIEEKGGFVLFSDNPWQKRDHISQHWLRNEFRECCLLTNLDEWYDYADDQKNPRQKGPRKLHRLTTHSLRHYFITKVYNHCKNPILTQKLARHTDLQSTQTYININLEKLGTIVDEVFEPENMQEKDNLMEFMQMYARYKQMKVNANKN